MKREPRSGDPVRNAVTQTLLNAAITLTSHACSGREGAIMLLKDAGIKPSEVRKFEPDFERQKKLLQLLRES